MILEKQVGPDIGWHRQPLEFAVFLQPYFLLQSCHGLVEQLGD